MNTPSPKGALAASRILPFNPEASANFEMPLNIGRQIAHWDNPKFAHSGEISHMRPDDYVVGFTHKNTSVAFPMWIVDYYHAVNCEIEGDPILFTSCERCQSGAAFLAQKDGKPLKFSAFGMCHAALTLTARDGHKSHWLHYEGFCLAGPDRYTFLPFIPTYHMTWEEWRELHPDTLVMLVPDNPKHRDARMGHGREEFFARPGMDPALAQTISGDLDRMWPENEMVLGINCDWDSLAFPLTVIKQAGGCLNYDNFSTPSLVVFAGPQEDGATMAAYLREIDGTPLRFFIENGVIRDQETEAEWNIEGLCLNGKYAGKRLTPLPWCYVRWHAWIYSHRSTNLVTSAGYSTPQVTTSFSNILAELEQYGMNIEVLYPIVNLALPTEAVRGLVIRLDGRRANLYQFKTPEAAHDYVTFQGAWFCPPISVRLGRKKSCRLGNYVIESDPERQYEGPTQFTRLPDSSIEWHVVFPKGKDIKDKVNTRRTFDGLFRHLRENRYDVVETAFLPRTQLPVGAENGMSATINGDRFVVYRYRTRHEAFSRCRQFYHCYQIGAWVFRSTPIHAYEDPIYEIGERPDDQVPWSALLSCPRFLADLKEFCDAEY